VSGIKLITPTGEEIDSDDLEDAGRIECPFCHVAILEDEIGPCPYCDADLVCMYCLENGTHTHDDPEDFWNIYTG
jgi:hypothetical protein